MKISDQVCSLELAKRLKELGGKQESLFCWVGSKHGDEDYFFLVYSGDSQFGGVYPRETGEDYSAFTVAELGGILRLGGQVWMPYFCDQAMDNGWVYKFQTGKIIVENTEADARAKMLIYLLESSLIVNK